MKIISRRGLIVALTSLVTFWISGAAAASYLIVERPVEQADLIVVLGGAAAYVERADTAAALFRAGAAPKILLTNDGLQSGWDESEKKNPYFYERSKSELIAKGVPASSIEILMTPVDGTMDEAKLVCAEVLKRNLTSFLIVTSPYHTRRALWSFQRINLKNGTQLTIGIKAALSGHTCSKWYCWWLSADSWMAIPSEYVKLAYYWLYF